ncbi:hypothetical protein FB451DRAFT_1556726 [Mycena latifolia]|nr:hypothetical protein FB451DRAFT_1556726 [Mycena latifolia]
MSNRWDSDTTCEDDLPLVDDGLFSYGHRMTGASSSPSSFVPTSSLKPQNPSFKASIPAGPPLDVHPPHLCPQQPAINPESRKDTGTRTQSVQKYPTHIITPTGVARMTGLRVVVHIRRSAAKYVPMVSLRVVTLSRAPCPFTTKCSVIADPPVGYTGLRRSTHAIRAVACVSGAMTGARHVLVVIRLRVKLDAVTPSGTAFLSRCYDVVTSNDAAERLRQHFRLQRRSCHPCLHSEGGGAIGPKRSIYVNGREK